MGTVVLTTVALGVATLAAVDPGRATRAQADGEAEATTPIRHVVVIFQENVSFDHYFRTYPSAANSDGQPFDARPDTPVPDGLRGPLLTANPNGVNPARHGDGPTRRRPAQLVLPCST